jgi:hypothetical protein
MHLSLGTMKIFLDATISDALRSNYEPGDKVESTVPLESAAY